MKKSLLSLVAILGFGLTAGSTTVDMTFSTLGYSNAQDVTEVKVDDVITLTFASGSNSNSPKYYSTGNAIRLYGGNKMTVSAESGYVITEFVVTTPTGSNALNSSSSVTEGTLSISGGTGTWTGNNVSSVTLTQGGTSGHARLQTISVTYTTTAPKTVDDVDIDYILVNGKAKVTLTCATDGAEIYYGESEDDVTTLYSAPFIVDHNTTIYAQGVKGDDKGAVANKAIEVPAIYSSLKALVDEATEGAEVFVEGNLEVLYVNGDYVMVTDGTNNALVYQYGETLTEGQKINSMTGKITMYGKLCELTGVTLTFGGEGATYTAKEMTSLEGINYNDMLFDELVFKGSNVSGISGKNATLTLGGRTIALYNTFGIDLEEIDNADVTGFVWRYNDNLQIAPVSITGGKVVEYVATPVIEPASTELRVGDLITITCDTPGAAIFYTLDGTDPTEESIPYEDPIEFTETCTVKARAYNRSSMTDLEPSEIAEAVYTLFDPNKPVTTETTFDFTTCEGIKFAEGFELPTVQSTGTNINGEPFSKDDVTVTVIDGSGTAARIWKTSSSLELRLYKNDAIVVAAPEGYVVTKIEYTLTSGALALASDQNGTYSGGTWTAAEDAESASVKFDVTTSAKITKMVVTIDQTTGIEDVDAVEEVAPVYYTLQGVKVAQPESGLYIVVRGNKVTKEVIR